VIYITPKAQKRIRAQRFMKTLRVWEWMVTSQKWWTQPTRRDKLWFDYVY